MHQIESFFWGIIAALGALVVQLILYIGFSSYYDPSYGLDFVQIFAVPGMLIASAFIEELFKYLIILKRVDQYSLEKSYLVNSFLVGFGFFATEITLISQNSNLPEVGALLEIATIHIGTAGIIGYLIATRSPKKISTFLLCIIYTVFLHSSYNFLVPDRNFITNFIIYIILFIIVIFNILNFFSISAKLAQD